MKKWEWYARYFGFVYFTRHRHVTGTYSQSNCIISLNRGPSGFHFLLWFTHINKILLSKQLSNTGQTPLNFSCLISLFGRCTAFYGHFLVDFVTSERVHLHTIITLLFFQSYILSLKNHADHYLWSFFREIIIIFFKHKKFLFLLLKNINSKINFI